MTHAGFWVDGAVRKPEAGHFDRNGWVIANWKDKQLDLDICRRNFDHWNKVYWLDTTPRESLTPEELLSVAKILWPDAVAVHKDGDNWYPMPENDEPTKGTPINWGNLTQYPPPVEPQWIRVTRENVAQYLFRECRFRDIETQTWRAGKISGWDEKDKCCLVYSDYLEDEPIVNWCIVEVQNAN